jgi:hypothetical protein
MTARRWPWVAGVFVVMAAAAGVAGANSHEPPAVADPVTPVVTQESTQAPEPTPDPMTEDPTPEPDPTTEKPAWDSTGYDETTIVLELTWADTDAEEREDLCFGWTYLGEDYVVDTLNSEGTFNEDAIRDFFEGRC